MRTSTSSSTSDPGPAFPDHCAALAARLRLAHPFPSLLNGLTVVVIALLAGGSTLAAVRLGLAMTAFQFAIGALNDLVDAPRDIDRVPPKPIPAGLVSMDVTRLVVVGSAIVGVALALPSGPGTAAVGLLGLGCGVIYDLRLSRTAASWLPLAIGLPLVPVFAWLGATGNVPPGVLGLVPLAMLAGVGLAIGNALVDVDADTFLGRRTIAVALGRRRAWLVHALTLMVTILLLLAIGPRGGGALQGALTVSGIAAVTGGLGLTAMRERSRWRMGWPLEAVGVATLGTGWFIALASAAP
ncbi:MAG: UbiA family prenyltransferase [Chloroflexota bacterium]